MYSTPLDSNRRRHVAVTSSTNWIVVNEREFTLSHFAMLAFERDSCTVVGTVVQYQFDFQQTFYLFMQRNAFRISNITAPGNSLNLCLGNNIWVALLPVTATKIYNIFINMYIF